MSTCPLLHGTQHIHVVPLVVAAVVLQMLEYFFHIRITEISAQLAGE
jgi:hypothetical protein